MLRVLLGLVLSYGLVVGAAFIAGFLIADQRSFALHFAIGLFATLFACLLYCIVLTYFIITGKLVKNAVARGHLDSDLVTRTQRLKGRVSAWIVLAVGATLAAALVGVLSHAPGGPYGDRGTWHMLAECAAVALNVTAFYFLWQLVHANGRLVGEVFEALQPAARSSGAWPSGGTTPAGAAEQAGLPDAADALGSDRERGVP